jgi:hypothetical protein
MWRGSFLTAHASADLRVGGAGPLGPGLAAPAAPFVEATGASSADRWKRGRLGSNLLMPGTARFRGVDGLVFAPDPD